MLAGALAAGAAVVGFACGSATKPAPRTSTLPPAGSPRDDGTGLLARWSVASPEGSAELSVGPLRTSGQGGASYGGTTYGMYGGMLYGGRSGGNRYGGSLYANYRFDTSVTPQTITRAVVDLYDDYAPQTIVNGGAIAGLVTWPRPPKAVTTLPTTAAGCSDGIANETLRIGVDPAAAKTAVAGALVYLERIKRGRTGAPNGSVLERRGCRFLPHVQLAAPIGAPLRVTNSEANKHTLRVARTEGDEGEPLSMDLEGGGQTETRSLVRAGTYRVGSTTPGDLASAYIIVPAHPYYAITGDDGRFRFDSVPPGTYTLVIWHEPVARKLDSAGAPVMTGPFVTKKTVKVSSRKTSKVKVKLPDGR